MCIPARQYIRTPSGEVLIETLNTNNKILTSNEKSVKIKVYNFVVKKTTVRIAQILIPAKTFGKKSPANDVLLSSVSCDTVKTWSMANT